MPSSRTHLYCLTRKGSNSFVSATTPELEPGITYPRGPSGPVESDVVDALGWVMGEQGTGRKKHAVAAASLSGGKKELHQQ